MMARILFTLAAVAHVAMGSLCVDHQTANGQILLAVQPCEDKTTLTSTESALSIFIRSGSGQPEAELAEALKAKLDAHDLAGYLAIKRAFEGESAASVKAIETVALDTSVGIRASRNYTIQDAPSALVKRGGCSMYWPGDCGLQSMDIHYYNDFFHPSASGANWVCLGECTDYVNHIWDDGTLSGSFYYTYTDCKFRSQNGWNGRTQNKCRAGAFYRLVQETSHVVQGTNPSNTIRQISGSIDGKDHWTPRICMSSSNSCSGGPGSDGDSYC